MSVNVSTSAVGVIHVGSRCRRRSRSNRYSGHLSPAQQTTLRAINRRSRCA